eukprot:scaffold12252_cov133-Skeletonema_dohrnii-CCMP3373.AAC.3
MVSQEEASNDSPCSDCSTPFVGIDVIDSGGELGRVAIAKQAFSAGDIVLSESPALVFSIDISDMSELLIKFLDAPRETQEMILDLYHGNDDSEMLDAQRGYFDVQIQALDHRDKSLLTADIAFKLLKICMYNSHAYHQNAGAGVQSSDSLGVPIRALFLIASKVEHSCAPNVEMNISENGMLQYKTFTNLKQGDRILYSYGPGYSQPRRRRQESLYETRQFLCQCKRCVDFDECSPCKCPSCKQHTMFEGWDLSDSGSYQLETYYCLSCDTQAPERDLLQQVDKVSHFEDKLEQIKTLLVRGELLLAANKCVQTMRNIEACNLSSLHWLYPAVWKYIRDTFSSLARQSMQRGVSPTHPEAANSLLFSGYSQLLDAMWTQQILDINNGYTSLKDASIAPRLSNASFGNPSLSTVKDLIDDLITDDTNMHSYASSILDKIFHAGQDLLLLGTLNSSIARLYAKYSVVENMSSLSREQRSWVALLIETNGDTNRFPNSLLMV